MYIEKLKLDAIGQLSRSIRDAFVADTCFYVSKYMHNKWFLIYQLYLY